MAILKAIILSSLVFSSMAKDLVEKEPLPQAISSHLRGNEHPSQERRLDDPPGEFCKSLCGNCGVKDSFKCNYSWCIGTMDGGSCNGQDLAKDPYCQDLADHCKLWVQQKCFSRANNPGILGKISAVCAERSLVDCISSCIESFTSP